MSIKITNLTQRYESASAPLFENFSVTFADKKISAVLGASGSGKTTLLNAVSDLIIHAGQIERGTVSYVFQDARLVENITVKDNLKLVLKSAYKNKAELNNVIDEYLSLAEIEKYKDAYPDELSGGERQLVSILRAFAYPSDTLLMDEPFNSLDYRIKDKLIKRFMVLQQKSPKTVLFVTHDVDEAVAIADDVYLLWDRPANIALIADISEPQNKRDVFSEHYAKLKKKIVDKLLLDSKFEL